MATFLIGGGWNPNARNAVYAPFLEAAGDDPTVACLVLDEGDGHEQFERWAMALTDTGPCRPVPVLVSEGSTLDLGVLSGTGAGALLVCGGLTPAYAAAVAPLASGLRDWLAEDDRPYAGFSAGSAVAAQRALVGGWLRGGVPVCPEDAREDLDEVTVVDGIGLVPFSVDVHAAQWGTLARLVAAVRAGLVEVGVAIDEDTLVTVDGDAATVSGLGRAHWVQAGADGVEVISVASGELLPTTPIR